jgi:hypothetical protein
MPGAYAHLTIAGLLASSNMLNKEPGFPNAAKADLLDYTCFCDLGAVSPDYPYLHLTSPSSAAWADHMHLTGTGKMLDIGVKEVQKLNGQAKKKMFAWLLGYASHVAADVTVHPVVELKVGPYLQNKTAHRVCEMHQDAYIFQRLNVGAVGLSEYLDSGIRLCSSKRDKKKLYKGLSASWRRILRTCHADQYKANPPSPNKWHAAFLTALDLAEESGRLPPISRHVAVNAGLTYPKVKDIDSQYIKALKTPEGIMDYDGIFNRAMLNVLRMWSALAAAIYADSTEYLSMIGDWSLDTGRNDRNKLVYWSETK